MREKMVDPIDRQAAIETALTFFVEYLGGAFDERSQKLLVERMNELPPAQQYMTATSNTMVSDTVKIPVMDATTERLPSAHGDAEFINWLLDEIWDEEMWELNYRAFPELLCRKLVKAGYLREEGGMYVRLDKQTSGD